MIDDIVVGAGVVRPDACMRTSMIGACTERPALYRRTLDAWTVVPDQGFGADLRTGHQPVDDIAIAQRIGEVAHWLAFGQRTSSQCWSVLAGRPSTRGGWQSDGVRLRVGASRGQWEGTGACVA